MQTIAITTDDGKLAVMSLTDKADVTRVVVRWALRRGVKVVSFKKISPSQLPTSRAFRDAWKHDGTAVKVDMVKARGIKMAQIRDRRNELLAESDVPMAVATETKNMFEQGRLTAKRQSLRDLPAAIDLGVIETPEELEAFTPDELKG